MFQAESGAQAVSCCRLVRRAPLVRFGFGKADVGPHGIGRGHIYHCYSRNGLRRLSLYQYLLENISLALRHWLL
jgi:hypothetical protein